jgi:hypothetical protein
LTASSPGKTASEFKMRDVAAQTQRRIERAEETKAALARIKADPSPENIAAFHRLHAEDLREDGDPERAARAEERAKHAESMIQRPLRLLADGDPHE